MLPIFHNRVAFMDMCLSLQRLKYINDKLDDLKPEIQILDPTARLAMLQPLERQVTDATISVKSLNVDYKLERMMNLEKDTTDLEVSGRHVVQDMDKVSQDVTAITSEMEQIAKG